MVQIDLQNEYFEWMYHLVCSDQYYEKVSYRKLFIYLHRVSYTPNIEMDDNRRIDGIDFRYRFGLENGYSDNQIETDLDIGECSMLEMMIALAFKVEEEVTADTLYGDRTGQWFWGMIVSLGLGCMNDKQFDQDYCESCVNSFLDQRYAPNGKGGLFTLDNPPEDLRNVDIWCQFMWYLNETIYTEKITFDI